MKESASKNGARGFAALALATLGLVSLGLSACDPTVTFGSLDDDGSTSAGPGSTTSGGSVPQGAECTDVLVDGVDTDVHDLVAGDGWLYFVHDHPWESGTEEERLSDVRRVPLAGGAPETLVQDVSLIASLILHGGRMYWSERTGAIKSSELDGTDVETLFQGTSGTYPVSLAVGDDAIYWSQFDGALRKIAPTGGPVSELRAAADGTIVLDVEIGEDELYLLDSNFGAVNLTTIPTTGGASTLVAAGTIHWVDLRLQGTDLYLVDYGASVASGGDLGDLAIGEGTIQRFDTTGATPPTVLAEGLPFPDSIAIDESGIYAGGGLPHDDFGGQGAVTYARRVGPTLAGTNVSALGVYFGVTECDHAVCWLNAAAGRIERYRECVP